MNEEPARSARRTSIDAILQHGDISRSDLAAITGLSRAAITEVIQELLNLGMLCELPIAYDRDRRGRPAIQLSLRGSHGYFIGVSVYDSLTLMVLTDLRGKTLAQCDLPFGSQPADLVKHVSKHIGRLVHSAGIEREMIRGIGIAMPGIVDQRKGICVYSAPLSWSEVPIGPLIQKATGLPTYVENNADAAAIGEKLFGLARELRDFSSIAIGRTIGCASYIDGRLYRGCNGGAGEIGHVTIDPSGPICQCGKRGCLDVIAGGTAIRSAAQEIGISIKSVGELEVMAANGSTSAIGLLRRAGQALGLAVANLIQINNPESVLFADLEGFGNGLFYTYVRQAIENNILPRFLQCTHVQFQPVEYSFLARGAASIAAEIYLRTAPLSFAKIVATQDISTGRRRQKVRRGRT